MRPRFHILSFLLPVCLIFGAASHLHADNDRYFRWKVDLGGSPNHFLYLTYQVGLDQPLVLMQPTDFKIDQKATLVWLLMGDGTTIPRDFDPKHTFTGPVGTSLGSGHHAIIDYTYDFTFKRLQGKSAVALVVSIENKWFVYSVIPPP